MLYNAAYCVRIFYIDQTSIGINPAKNKIITVYFILEFGSFGMKKVFIIALATLSISASTAVLAEGDAAAAKEKATTVCAACHGADGNSAAPNFPKLAGQHPSYIKKQLHDFKSDRRVDPVMSAQAKPLTDQEIEDLAAYYSEQAVVLGAPNAEKVVLGESVYRGGNVEKKVTACAACHGPTASGNAASSFPSLSGQHSTYVKKQLHDFKKEEGGRANDPSSMMRNIAANMSDKEIDAVAEYITAVH